MLGGGTFLTGDVGHLTCLTALGHLVGFFAATDVDAATSAIS